MHECQCRSSDAIRSCARAAPGAAALQVTVDRHARRWQTLAQPGGRAAGRDGRRSAGARARCRRAVARSSASTRHRHPHRARDARSGADARGDARGRQRVRGRAAARATSCERGDRPGCRAAPARRAGRGVRLHRRQGRRRRHHRGGERRDRAGQARPASDAADRPAPRRTATPPCSWASSRGSRSLDALENMHRLDAAFFSGWSTRPRRALDLLASSERAGDRHRRRAARSAR